MKNLFAILLFFCTLSAFVQKNSPVDKETEVDHKYRFSFPYFIPEEAISDSWDDRQSTKMIEFHVKCNLDNKNIIGLKFVSWRLFQPMGIQYWDDFLDKLETESEFYPRHVKEKGIGITYQRMLWKGLFAMVEALPQYQTYQGLNGDKIRNYFKLYNSYHLGYHVSRGKKKRFFIEPKFIVTTRCLIRMLMRNLRCWTINGVTIFF